jgi:hypothetical protein
VKENKQNEIVIDWLAAEIANSIEKLWVVWRTEIAYSIVAPHAW